MELIIYGRLAAAMTTAVSRRPSAPDGWRRQRQRIHEVVRARFSVDAIGCRVPLSCSCQVRTPHKYGLIDASPETSDGGSR
jgi:hypothetical protein